jgi:hypothetical protein
MIVKSRWSQYTDFLVDYHYQPVILLNKEVFNDTY